MNGSARARGVTARTRRGLAVLAALVLAVASVYLVVRVGFALRAAPWQMWLFTAILSFGELFFIVQGFGYAANLLRGTRHADPAPGEVREFPPVAVFVSSYNEPVLVLRATLTAAMALDYPAKRVYLVDDSTKAETVAALHDLCAELGIVFLHRRNRRGFKAGALNDALAATTEPLLLLLDADQRPDPDFLRDNVPRLLARKDAAYVQTPQVYENIGDSLVAFAAEIQQTGFYDFMCVGKDTVNALFYLGTNAIVRREAVAVAGGFAEDSVTEDFCTSYRLHRAGGWRSAYRTKLGVRGSGPPNLIAYFNQQYRWAFGNLAMIPEYLRDFRRKTAFRAAQRWEYFLSTFWWFHGWATLALALLPPAFFLFGARVLSPDLWVYLAALAPYLIVSNLLTILALRARGYSGRGALLGQSLSMISFSVSIKASLDALRGKRVPFKVTAKGKGLVYVPFRTLAPQLALLGLNVAGMAAGLWSLVGEPVLALLLLFAILLAVMGVWGFLTRARELRPLRIAEQRAAWRAFQRETVAFLAVTAAFLLGVNLLDVASRTPAVLSYFLSQWSVAFANALAAPGIFVTLFWAAYNTLLLYGALLFRVGVR